jgi:hypothetical protein
LVLFDKTGTLAGLQARSRAVTPKQPSNTDLAWIKLAIQQTNDKVVDNLQRDASTALLSMHTCLHELIASHYKLQCRFQVSSKKLLVDLDGWDARFAQMLIEFVGEPQIERKARFWSDIVDYVCVPFGGRSMLDKACTCESCLADLAKLTATE